MVPLLNAELTSKERVNIFEIWMAWCKTAPYFFIFLIHNNILAPRLLLSNRQYFRYAVMTLAVIVGIFGVVNTLQTYLLPHLAISRPTTDRTAIISLTDLHIYLNIMFSTFMCLGNSGIKLIYKSMRDDHIMEALKHQNLSVEMEYLKYQINPHFFMNTLNNIHALIDIDSESAKSAVVELSKMMRYVLYDSGSEAISLDRDLRFIYNYVELMKIRYENMANISYNYPTNLPPTLSIPPLLLIVFVENAFKHGALNRQDSFVNIEINYRAPKLHCRVTNSNAPTTNSDKRGGIGLKNVRKRLELKYGNRFALKIKERDNRYSIHLVIPINDAKNNSHR